MDNSSNFPRNRPSDHHLGVNKLGKSIRKSPFHQPSVPNPNPAAAKQPQPQVYNISKNDFRSIVQQLTGSPSQDRTPSGPSLSPLPPPHNPPKHPSLRLQRIRPPPLSRIARPPIGPIPMQTAPAPGPFNPAGVNQNPASPFFGRPPGQFPSGFSPLPPPRGMGGGDSLWANTGESPISAYMRYLQNSIVETGPHRPGAPPHPHPSAQQQQPPPFSSGILPTPPPNQAQAFPSPRDGGPGALLPSPTMQFGFPSPSSFLNLLSPRSPYPLLSPGFHFPPPLTPNFAFAQSPGILGPGPHPPPSPGLMFPPSPSGFFPILSPRWRE